MKHVYVVALNENERGSFKTASYDPRHKKCDFSMRKYLFDKPSELGTLFCTEKNWSTSVDLLSNLHVLLKYEAFLNNGVGGSDIGEKQPKRICLDPHTATTLF